MLYEKIDTTVYLFPINPIRDFFAKYREGLEHAALLLAGRQGCQLVAHIVDALSSNVPLSRSTKRQLKDLIDILKLENIFIPNLVRALFV